jgi:hypothetical protein
MKERVVIVSDASIAKDSDSIRITAARTSERASKRSVGRPGHMVDVVEIIYNYKASEVHHERRESGILNRLLVVEYPDDVPGFRT